MEKDASAKRLQMLDGIRGIAIVLVFLNHVEFPFSTQFLHPLIAQMLFSSGVTGVSLLFILSGFLMAYIYPNPSSYSQFLQKRYTRIFPLFLTMSTVMLFYKVFPEMAWYLKALLILGLSLGVHAIWVYGIKKIASTLLSKLLFYAFVALQIFAALFYTLWIMRQPPIVLNQQLPETLRNGIIWLTNATLTLPFGTYIPQLDGVYWSLTSEILFYVVYPIICVPLIGLMIKKNRTTKILVLLALIPFFAGLQTLSQRVYGFGILQFQLFYYFICGITLAYLYRNHTNIFDWLGKLFSKKVQFLTVLLFLTAIFAKTLIFDQKAQSLDVWIHILWAIPFGLVIALALSDKTMLSKFLSSKILVFLGTISFSIYLSHIPIGLIIKQIFQPTDVFTNIVYACLHFGMTVLVSMLLYYLLERPYFMRRNVNSIKSDTKKKLQTVITPKKAYWTLATICLVLIIAIFNSYQSSFNFFSKEYAIDKSTINPASLRESTVISMRENPRVTVEFVSPDDNLQVLTVNVGEQIDASNKDRRQIFTFKIKEAGAKDWYATNTYNLDTPIASVNHPLGFPTINNAKGKKYLVEFSVVYPSSGKNVLLNTTPTMMSNVVPVDKKKLLSNPVEFILFLENKLQNIFRNDEAKRVLTLLSPFFIITLYLIFSGIFGKRIKQ